MKNLLQEGDVITVTAPYALTSGGGCLVGSLFGVAVNTAASGAEAQIAMTGVVSIAKTSALAIAQGDKLYWDNTNKVVNKTSSGNTFVGVAVAAAANPSSVVSMRLGITA